MGAMSTANTYSFVNKHGVLAEFTAEFGFKARAIAWLWL
jgi:hypothetical protein